MVGLLGGLTEVKRGQKGKNICLQESHKQFNEVHENHERHRKIPVPIPAAVWPVITDDEDQEGQGQNDDVPRPNVRRQSNHQYRGLEQDAHHLYRHQNQLDGKRHPGGPKDVAPIMAVARHRRNDEDKRGQGQVSPPPFPSH